jgi:acetolactate synthase-1/2/3 large subunit
LTNTWDASRISEIRQQWWDGPIEFTEQPLPGIVKPQDVLRVMSHAMTAGDDLVTDASLSSGWGAGRWQTKVMGRHYYAPRGLAGLGWGLPAAVGVATARKVQGGKGRVVCIAGDGGWAYSLQEIETAARTGLAIISVVLNNSTLGWIKHSANTRYPGEMVSEHFLDVSYAEAGHALGAATESVDSVEAFEAAFKKALDDKSDRPWVIEVHSDSVETPVQKDVKPHPGKGGY